MFNVSFNRWLLTVTSLFTVVLAIGFATSITPKPSRAQVSEPTALIDAIFADLSQRLGKSLNRQNVDAWNWEQDVFTDTSLGCPQAGQTYTFGTVIGYKITITVNGTTFDYRAPKNGSNSFFLCSPAQVTTTQPNTAVPPITAPTIAPIVVTPTAIAAQNNQPTANTPSGGTPTSGGQTYQNGLAYVAPDGNIHIRTLDGTQDTALTTDSKAYTVQALAAGIAFNSGKLYTALRWSPDGSKLLFQERNARLIEVVPSGGAPYTLVNDYGTNAQFAFPAAWTADGSQVAFMAAGLNGGPDQLFTVPVQPGQSPTLISNRPELCSAAGTQGTFTLESQVWEREVSWRDISWLNWVNQTPIIEDLCHTLAAVNAQGVVWRVPNINPAPGIAISPDGKRAIVMVFDPTAKTNAATLIDLSNGNQTALNGLPQGTANTITALAWTADGQNILYATSTPATSVAVDPNNALIKQLGATTILTGKSFHVSLWRVPVAGGTPTSLFDQEGFQIGTIAPVPDNSGAVVSLVTSSADFIQALSGAQTLVQAAPAAPHSELYFIPLDSSSGSPRKLGLGGIPAFSSGTFAAVAGTASAPAVSQCPGAPPSRLTVGGTGHVTPGTPNLLRAQPGGATIGTIPGGAAFTVLQGPTCTTDGIAWWQVNYNGQVGWTAEGQGNTYFLQP